MFRSPAPSAAKAAGLTLVASAFIAGTTLFAKFLATGALGPPLPALQISHGRFLFAFLIIGGVFLWRGKPLETPAFRMHFGRSLFGWAGISLMFASTAFIPLSDATAISFLNPVFGMVLAVFFLGEIVGRLRWVSAGISLTGAVILLRPTVSSFEPAALLALGAALFFGAELILIKRLTNREPAAQILLMNNLLGLLISTVAVSVVWQMPSARQWVALAAIGGLMAIAQMCFVNAMARSDASFVSPFLYFTLIFAALYDAVVFGVLPGFISLLGMGIILAGAVLLAGRGARDHGSKHLASVIK